MSKWRFYWYPNCTSCRDAASVLKRLGLDFERIHIYDNPPSRAELEKIASLLPGGVEQLIATRGVAFRELGLAGKALSPNEWLDLIEAHPRLLRRPILTDGTRAIVGFKRPEYETLAGDSCAGAPS